MPQNNATQTSQGPRQPLSPVAVLAEGIFDDLVRRFPVCLYSDEFHFFPQTRANCHDWAVWDDFSRASVQTLGGAAAYWGAQLGKIANESAFTEDRIDATLLGRALVTLTEQLSVVRSQCSQPTFHLTVAAMGLAEAVEHSETAWRQRAAGLPGFMGRAVACLDRVPRLFSDMGLEMIDKLDGWMRELWRTGLNTGPAIEAFAAMSEHLKRISAVDAFLLDPDLYAVVAKDHVGCRMSLADIGKALDDEIEETRSLLAAAAAKMAPGNKWQTVVSGLPQPGGGGRSDTAWYAELIDALGRHCVEKGFMTGEILEDCPVRVAPVPSHLTPVRSSAAYSMPPGHPSRGGTFYTMPDGARGGLPADWRLLTAHETYPGHHLLDLSRWNHSRSVRRHLEFPLFYEGWASFSEEILFDTGFFSDKPENSLLMAKRRFWRAMRGRVDLYLHSGQKSLDAAAGFLVDAGMPLARATAMVRRYALKPGYQLCYTVGRRRFRSLYDRYRQAGGAAPEFARIVLAAGEIGFDNLAQRLFPEK